MRQTVPLLPDPYEVAHEYFRSREASRAPALYFMDEIPQLLKRTPQERHQIHKAKLKYPGSRIVQDG